MYVVFLTPNYDITPHSLQPPTGETLTPLRKHQSGRVYSTYTAPATSNTQRQSALRRTVLPCYANVALDLSCVLFQSQQTKTV